MFRCIFVWVFLLCIFGLDIVGMVDEVGFEVGGLQVGDMVFGMINVFVWCCSCFVIWEDFFRVRMC